MLKAKIGDKVQVHYVGKLQDGSIFDSSLSREPLEFTIGENQLLPLFEKAIEEMSIGEKKSISISAEDGYGLYMPELCFQLPREEFQPEFEPIVGLEFEMLIDDKHSVFVFIKEINDEFVTIEANHMLAGKDLNFEVELMNIFE